MINNSRISIPFFYRRINVFEEYIVEYIKSYERYFRNITTIESIIENKDPISYIE